MAKVEYYGQLRFVSKKGGILLANSEVPKFVYPTCLLGRQKSLGNLRKKKYYQNFEVDSPTVSGGFSRLMDSPKKSLGEGAPAYGGRRSTTWGGKTSGWVPLCGGHSDKPLRRLIVGCACQ